MPPTAPSASPVQWEPALLGAPVEEAVETWKRSLHGFAKRLPSDERARFLMALDSACYFMHGESAILANDGLHPKHRLLAYHGFFADRVSPGEAVIDLGSGVGALAATLAHRGARVTGMEWMGGHVATARARVLEERVSPLPTFIHGDITSDRAPGEYDAVVLSNVLEHVADRERLLRMWGEWYRPRRFLIRVPAFDRDWRVAWKRELGVEWRCDPTHETEYTRESLEREVAGAGLRVEHLTTCWGEYWVEARPLGGGSGGGDGR